MLWLLSTRVVLLWVEYTAALGHSAYPRDITTVSCTAHQAHEGTVATCVRLLQVSHTATSHSGDLCDVTTGVTHSNIMAQWRPVWCYYRCHTQQHYGTVATCVMLLQVSYTAALGCSGYLCDVTIGVTHSNTGVQVSCRSHHAMWPSAYLCCDTTGAMQITSCNVAQCLPVLWHYRCHAGSSHCRWP